MNPEGILLLQMYLRPEWPSASFYSKLDQNDYSPSGWGRESSTCSRTRAGSISPTRSFSAQLWREKLRFWHQVWINSRENCVSLRIKCWSSQAQLSSWFLVLFEAVKPGSVFFILGYHSYLTCHCLILFLRLPFYSVAAMFRISDGLSSSYVFS